MAPILTLSPASLSLPALALLLAGVAPPMDAPPAPDRNPPAHAAVDPRLEEAQRHFEAGETRRALAVMERMVDEESATGLRYEALWRSASYAVALGVEREAGEVTGVREPPPHWYDLAERRAQAAVELRPEGAEGRYWTLAVLGRRALEAGPREASDLSDRMLALALGILADHPDHAPTHNALGRLHLEIMSTSGVTRFFGRAFTGGAALRAASWEEARTHLERAVALAPDQAMFLLDLGRYHRARGNRSEARGYLERAVDAAGDDPPDRIFAREARELLREVGR